MLTGNSIVYNQTWPSGGIGRHKGLKIPRRQLRAGSSPASATTQKIEKYLGVVTCEWK